jgi:hypothetical protein
MVQRPTLFGACQSLLLSNTRMLPLHGRGLRGKVEGAHEGAERSPTGVFQCF